MDLEEFKQQVNIVDYMAKHYPEINMNKNGSVYKCKCIFHEEKTPSMAIYYGSNSFKCFGCGEHGDLIDIVKKKENVAFEEACEIIANNEGIDYSVTKPNPAAEKYKNEMKETCKRYYDNFWKNQTAIDYMTLNRGFTKETLIDFKIGFTYEDEYKYNTLGGISNRIAIPILEARNKVSCVGIAYRTITKEDTPKYINSHNSEFFIKGDNLFGLYQARQSIKQKGYALLVEGYMDVMALHQTGIKNVVGVMGTAITPAQLLLLNKYTNNVILMLDSDAPGVTAMEKNILAVIKSGFNAKICIIGSGDDPDDMCKKNNYDLNKVSNIIRTNTKDASRYLIDKEVASYEEIVVNKRKEIINKLSPLFGVMNSNDSMVMKDILLKRLDMK